MYILDKTVLAISFLLKGIWFHSEREHFRAPFSLWLWCHCEVQWHVTFTGLHEKLVWRNFWYAESLKKRAYLSFCNRVMWIKDNPKTFSGAAITQIPLHHVKEGNFYSPMWNLSQLRDVSFCCRECLELIGSVLFDLSLTLFIWNEWSA